MTFNSRTLKAAVVCLASVLASCGQSSLPTAGPVRVARPGVDLVPVAFVTSEDENIYKQFCDLHGDMLFIHIANMGREDSPPWAFRVTFALKRGEAKFTVNFQGLPAGTVRSFPLAIPAFCYKPDCSFRIRADAKDDVAESNEWNNLAFGLCEKVE